MGHQLLPLKVKNGSKRLMILQEIFNISISFIRMYKSCKNVNFSGIPFDLTFHSSSTGRYKTHYNLSWTLKSFVPIQKTELQYKNKVSNVLSCMHSGKLHTTI